MILFMSDWDRFPAANIDRNTQNTSFIKFAAKLHSQGIKNCLWPLSTLDPDLIGVDARDEGNLTLEQKAKIKVECQRNFWYYLRECLLVPAKVGLGGTMFRANEGNMSMFWAYHNHIDYMLVQPRQTGKTISVCSLISWLSYIRYRNARIGFVTKDDALRGDTARTIRSFRGSLPSYLTVADKHDSITDSVVTYKTRQNVVALAVGRSDEGGAYKVGRGNSVPSNFWDELPYISNARIAYGSAMASTDAVYEEAKRKGEPYGSVITTTAGRRSSRDGAFAYEIYSNAAKWTNRLYDCLDREDLIRMVRSLCTDDKVIINGTWSHLKMGVSDRLHYDHIANAKVKGDDLAADYFNIWPLGGSSNPLPKSVIDRIAGSQRESMFDEQIGGFIINWYFPEEIVKSFIDRPIIIGADTSEGGGRDALSLVFTDPESLAVLGTSVVNLAFIPDYGDFLAKVLIKYKRSVFMPERKSTGQTFIDILCQHLVAAGFDPFKRIFNYIVHESDTNPVAFNELVGGIHARTDAFYLKRKTRFGFNTGLSTRLQLYNQCLNLGTEKGAGRIHSQQLINELLGLQEKKGRIDHADGGHDDTVIAWLLTIWFLLYGRRHDYYGIDPSIVMRQAVDVNELSLDERVRRERLGNLNERVAVLVKESERASAPFHELRIEKELQAVYTEIESLGGKNDTLSSKLDDMRTRRQRGYGGRPYG